MFLLFISIILTGFISVIYKGLIIPFRFDDFLRSRTFLPKYEREGMVFAPIDWVWTYGKLTSMYVFCKI